MEQRCDESCLRILAEQDSRHRHFHEGPDGALPRWHPVQLDLVQIILPKVLRRRALRLSHYCLMPGHPGLNRMYYHIRRIYYWPQLAEDVAATVHNCAPCARNLVKLRKHTKHLKLFPAEEPCRQYLHTKPPPQDGAGKEAFVGNNRSILQAESSGSTPDDERLLCGDRLLRSMDLKIRTARVSSDR